MDQSRHDSGQLHQIIEVVESPTEGEGDWENQRENDSTTDVSELREVRKGSYSAGFNDDIARRESFRKQYRLSKLIEDYDDPLVNEEEVSTLRDANPPNYSNATLEPTQSPHSPLFSPINARDDEIYHRSVPIEVLAKFVDPSVLSEVKAYLKFPPHSAPGSIRFRERQPSENTVMRISRAEKFRADLKVRRLLNNLPPEETADTLYLSLVRKKMLKEVEALFEYAVSPEGRVTFNKNCHDVNFKDAITIAIDNRDDAMMATLIHHGVNIGNSIFHAIEAEFLQGLKLLLMWDSCKDLKITKVNPHFQVGMTPMILAAHKNNYQMLLLLHENGHQLTDLQDWSDRDYLGWEAINECRLICQAKAQPAHITLTCEVYHTNPIRYCMQLIKKVRKFESSQRESNTFYEELREQIEEYMCSLLDFISSSNELSEVFQYECPTRVVGNKFNLLSSHMVNTSVQKHAPTQGSTFDVFEMAIDTNLVGFVTHRQSQLAISYLRFRSSPTLSNTFLAYALGLLFPIFSLFYLFAPNTFLGSVLTLPVVSYGSHIMSDLAFGVILLLKIKYKTPPDDHLGEAISGWEWLIILWISGKWIQEFQECFNRGWRSYFRDDWNYSDMLTLILFTTSIVLRLIDCFQNRDHSSGNDDLRYQWGSYEPRLIAEGFQAWAYLFFFLRILGLTRVNRYLGPLTVSLSKMLYDIIRFLFLFSLMFLAFGFGLSDLYWYYGTQDAVNLFCGPNATETSNCKPKTEFTSMGNSMQQLFWALFGLVETSATSLRGKHHFTEVVGTALFATYHVVALIVMLNMLIAMMSDSFDSTSKDEENVWKFHRTELWLRFIRREVTRPPPMNLIPNPWRTWNYIKRMLKYHRAHYRSWQQHRRNRQQSASGDQSKRQLALAWNSREETFALYLNGEANVMLKPILKQERAELVQRQMLSNTTAAKAKQESIFIEQNEVKGCGLVVFQDMKKKLELRLQGNRTREMSFKLGTRYKLKYLVPKHS